MANAEPKNVNLRLERFEYRAVFSKTGRAKYISHLDLMRAFQRVFKRAPLPIWHTQGFNPHVYIMFPLALPLGTDSRVEIMDFALTEDIPYGEVLERMNAQTPVGLEIVSVSKPEHKHTDITSAEYVARLRREGHTVLMVGDGINDSPALSEADAGIAISDGAAIAREIADITIAADSLWELVELRQIAMALMARIHSNYRFVIGFNGALIALGVAGVLPPATSATLHNFSTLGVSLRSMSQLVPSRRTVGGPP